MERIITKEELNKILSEVIKEYELFAPVKKNEIVFLKQVKEVNEIVFDYSNTINSIKEVLFPERETLFEYVDGFPKIVSDIKQVVVFGVRPCDASALSILDKVFGGDIKDNYYFDRRNKTILLGLTCNNIDEACFCTYFNEHGPNSSKNMDILFTDLDDNTYFAEVITDNGKKLLKQYGKEPDETQKEKKQKKYTQLNNKITKKIKIPENLEKLFKNEYLEKISRKCITCGICRYLCPTCTCFSISDEDSERVRYWQPCSFVCFTKETAGTNPREKKKDRFKQWYYHKFDYSKNNIGMIVCVGCGRCIKNCPVKIDFTEVLNNINV